MALRPASRTISSLTGIAVMAAVLWLLLNFVYAPSCGRFACSLEPAWWPRAEADSGDACPDSISSAADDAEWAANRLAALRETDAKVTTGLFYDAEGIEHTFRENNITYGVVVINNERGPCGTDPDAPERYSCGVVVPAILSAGSTLAIWSPKDLNQSVKLSGRAQ